jgi:hypothetical protein
VAIDGGAVDPVDTQRARGKRRGRHGRRHQRIDFFKQAQERRAQGVAPEARLHVVDAAIGATAGHDSPVVLIGSRDRLAAPARDGRGLLGIGDRFQDAIEHVRR